MNAPQMEALHILILGLAVYRGTSLLSAERGPCAMLQWIRVKCGVIYTEENGQEVAIANTELSKLISCPLCLSVWLGAIASLLYITLGIAAVWMALPLALSAFSIIVGSLVDR